MPTDIYLIRKNQNFAKYKQAEEVTLTSSESYSIAVTGTNTNDLIYPPSGVPVPAAGSLVYFSSVTGGGTAIAASRMYYVINTTATTFQLAVLPDSATAVVLTSDITAGVLVVLADDEIKVWSSEFRDTFATQGSVASESSAATFPIASQFSFPGVGSGAASTSVTYVGGIASGATTSFTPTVSVTSDEAAHAPLRQTLLKRTHWKIDMGATLTPRYLYACWQDGDTWSTTPPDTK
jgi:hypothetical protein